MKKTNSSGLFKNFLVLTIFLSSLFFSKKSSAQSPGIDTLLNNKVYTIELEEDMGKKNKTYPDELSFKGDKLKSKYLTVEEKFKSGKFTASLDANSTVRKVNFEATTKNEKGETISWVGTVTGDEIEGTGEWTKKDESTRMMYNFTGSLKVKKGR